MTTESIGQKLTEILGKISRSDLDSAQNDIEFMLLDDQLPRVTQGNPRPDKGSDPNELLYAFGRQRARMASEVIMRLGRALTHVHQGQATLAQQEIERAILVWTPAVPKTTE